MHAKNARLINQLLGAFPYPLSKDAFIGELRAMDADSATLAWLEFLPNTTFNCAREIRDHLAKLEGSVSHHQQSGSLFDEQKAG